MKHDAATWLVCLRYEAQIFYFYGKNTSTERRGIASLA